MSDSQRRYDALIEKVFFENFDEGLTEFEFSRDELSEGAAALGIPPVKNIGDVVYAYRYRKRLPEKIRHTQVRNREWIIEGAGFGRYRFRLVANTRVVPQEGLDVVRIPDATPGLIREYALNDEQSLLAIVRYNRLIDVFLGLTTYSLQNHLRTTVTGLGQIEIDELYVGIDKDGQRVVIPVQAKGGTDQVSVVQTTQDIRFSEQRFPHLTCRAVSVQFMGDGCVALFELARLGDEVRVVEERHYRLVRGEDPTRTST